MTSEVEFRGIFPYIVSPITTSGDVDRDALEALITHLLARGVTGLSPLGSTGEAMFLTLEQRKAIVAQTVQIVAGRVPVVPGVTAFATHDAVLQTKEFVELGADGVVAMLQTYFPIPPDCVVEYFAAIAGACDVPIVLYTNPRLGSALGVPEVIRLADYGNIRYLKDATGVTGRLLSIKAALGERIKFFAASAHIPSQVLDLGGVGWMAGPACIVPEAAVLLYDLHRAGRRADVSRLQLALWPLNELFAKYSLAAFVKAALGAQGIPVGDAIAPQPAVPAHALVELSAVLERIDDAVREIDGVDRRDVGDGA